MGYGGYHPYPRRFGGGRPRLRIVHDALNAARGTAVDASNPATVAWVENMAHARAITFDGYGVNERLSMQWDPDRMTAFLSRWERILGVFPAPGATDKERRVVVRERMRRFIEATAFHSRLIARLEQELGDVFVEVEYIDIDNAIIHVPDASYPWGTVVAGVPWLSTVAHILVYVQKPTGYTEGDFYEVAGKVFSSTDGLIPAWCTIDWYRTPASGTAIAVTGGPSHAGFYLDDEHNLDNNVFDSYAPDDESGLTGWYNVLNESEGTLATLTDLSSNGVNFTSSGGSTSPTVVAGAINGRKALFFDGVDDRMAQAGIVSDLIADSAFTIFVVWKAVAVNTNDSTPSANDPLITDGTNNAVGLYLRTEKVTATVNPPFVVAENIDAGGSDVINHDVVDHVAPHWCYMRHSGGVLYLSVDGGAERSVSSGDTADMTGALKLATIAGVFFHGYYGEILIYETSLSTAAISRVGAYLRHIWGF